MGRLSLSFLPLALPALALGPEACQLGNCPTLDRIIPLSPTSPKACLRQVFALSVFHSTYKKKKKFCFCLILILHMKKHSLFLVSNQKSCRSLNQLKPTSNLAFPSIANPLCPGLCAEAHRSSSPSKAPVNSIQTHPSPLSFS